MLFSAPFIALSANARGRDFCIGDLHGCLAMLEQLLLHVCFDPARDRLFAVGDLVHRGPSSVECLELAEQPWFYTVMGNHEAMQLGAYRGAINRRGKLLDALCEYSGPTDALIPGWPAQPRMERILECLPLAIEFPLTDGRKVGIVHAGLPNGRTWSEVRAMVEQESALFEEDGHLQRRILWDRLPVIAATTAATPGIEKDLQALFPTATRHQYYLATRPVEGLDLLISGHTILPSKRPLTTGARLYLDTGAGELDGRLTLIELKSMRYWQIADPRVAPSMAVTEHQSIPRSNQDLHWISDTERKTMEIAERAGGFKQAQ